MKIKPREIIKLDKGEMYLGSDKCVNSNHKARFLSEEAEDYCQCSWGECKVRVLIAYNGHYSRAYILTESEINKLLKLKNHA